MKDYELDDVLDEFGFGHRRPKSNAQASAYAKWNSAVKRTMLGRAKPAGRKGGQTSRVKKPVVKMPDIKAGR